ncbi:hypothetical protein AALP_AA6G192600 [Arabis alpina]|nr:hypothetical protein AALP_AA6G192600 [Arabis alpina]
MENQHVDEAFGFESDGLAGRFVTVGQNEPTPTSQTDVDVGLTASGPTVGVSMTQEGKVIVPRASVSRIENPTSWSVPKDPMPRRVPDDPTSRRVVEDPTFWHITKDLMSTNPSGDPMRSLHLSDDVPMGSICGGDMPMDDDDPMRLMSVGDLNAIDSLSFVDPEDPRLPLGRADTKKVASTQRVKVRPDPPGSTLSKKESLQHLWEKCRISQDIELVVPSSVDRADAPPLGYLTLFENYFDQCLLWFPLPGTEHLSYLTDFRVRGQSDELKYSVTNTSGVALIAGFPSKDDHFEDLKPSFPKVSKKFVEAMHKELSSVNGNWKESFSRKRIKRVLSTEIISGKILGRGRARVSSREQAALEAAAKAARSSGADAPRAVVSMTLTPTATLARARSSRPLAPKTLATLTLLPPLSLTPNELAMRHKHLEKIARLSSGKGKGIDYGTFSKKQRVDTHPGVVVEREVSASRVAAPKPLRFDSSFT